MKIGLYYSFGKSDTHGNPKYYGVWLHQSKLHAQLLPRHLESRLLAWEMVTVMVNIGGDTQMLSYLCVNAACQPLWNKLFCGNLFAHENDI